MSPLFGIGTKKTIKQETNRDWESVDDFRDLPVQRLINFSTGDLGNFIVFINSEGDIDWKTTGIYDNKVREKECNKILGRIAILDVIPAPQLPDAVIMEFRTLLAEALARCIHDDVASSKSLLDTASKFISERNQEVGRWWLVSAATLATILVLAVVAIVWISRAIFVPFLGINFFPLLVASASGAIGSLLSVLTRAAKLPLEPNAGRYLHYVEGVAHIVVGTIGGLVVYLAIRAGLLAPEFLKTGMAGQVLACMVGGSSERLVPAIIRRVEVAASAGARAEN